MRLAKCIKETRFYTTLDDVEIIKVGDVCYIEDNGGVTLILFDLHKKMIGYTPSRDECNFEYFLTLDQAVNMFINKLSPIKIHTYKNSNNDIIYYIKYNKHLFILNNYITYATGQYKGKYEAGINLKIKSNCRRINNLIFTKNLYKEDIEELINLLLFLCDEED